MLKFLPFSCVFLTSLSAFSGGPDEPPLIRYAYSQGEITRLCEAAIEKFRGTIETIKRRSSLEKLLIPRSLLAFETAADEFGDEVAPLTFMSSVSRDAAMRAESSACEEKIGQFYPTLLADKALYESLKRAIPLTPAQRRLRAETLRGFEKNGMKLPDAELAHLKELKQKLATLEAKFALNLNNDRSQVLFTKEELAGATENFLARLEKSPDGKFIVTTKSTDFLQVMENVRSPESRKRMMFSYLNKGGAENTSLLEHAVKLRGEIAKILGFPSWADVQMNGRMAKSSAEVLEFLNGLKAKLIARKDRDLAKLLEFKRTLDPKAKVVNAEDVAYLTNQLKKKEYALDEELVAEYFPAEKTMDGVFAIYSTLFGVKFVEVPNAKVWAEGVRLYEIRDQASGKLRAYFFKDTIPREGKYGHAAAFPLVAGRSLGSHYATPVAAIVANFTPPGNGRPALLQHDEVETLFHEFGHIMHQTLTLAPYGSLSGSSVAQDFVEAPSQMLENWAWNAEILKSLSAHYRTGAPLPPELIQKMLAAKDFNQGFAYIRQLLFGLFDMRIHSTREAVDVTKVYNEMHLELFGYPVVEGTHFPAGFGHLMGGYDAGYYGYLWSEVYAQDLFSRFEREGLLNPKTGADYRQAILESGNMREAIELLRQFLGREPNSQAFYRKLGL